MIHPDTFKKVDFSGAKGLIFLGDKIIVYRRDNKTALSPGFLDLPGGGREADESPFDTLQREVMEEFGISISRGDILASFSKNSQVHPGTKSFFFVTKELAFKEKDVVFGNEGTNWMLMPLREFILRPDGIERQQKRAQSYVDGTMVSE